MGLAPARVLHFFWSGFFEALGALLTLVALTTGQVAIVSPIVATTPLFSLVLSLVFLRARNRLPEKRSSAPSPESPARSLSLSANKSDK